MTWQPATTVTIDELDYTGDTVGTVTIRRGRDTVYADPVAGYATVQLIDKTGESLDIVLGTRLDVTVEDSTTADVALFSGLVTDVSRQLYDPGLTGDPASITQVSAVGPLARMARRQIFASGRPAETDGDRIAAAIADGLAASWEETAGTWATVATSTATWTSIDPIDLDLIDAGLFDLAALPAQGGGRTAYQAASEASFSGEGVLYETGDGFVGWDNADSRGTSPDYLDIAGNLLRADGITTDTSLTDLVNRVEVVHDEGVALATEPESIIQFGRYDRRIDTQLANASNAETRAAKFIERHAFPLDNLSAVTIRVDGLPDSTADDLLSIDINKPVFLTDLPDTIGVTQLPGFVEGVEYRIDPYRLEITLNVSDAQLSIGDSRWSQVPATLRWNQVDATLTWEDARSF